MATDRRRLMFQTALSDNPFRICDLLNAKSALGGRLRTGVRILLFLVVAGAAAMPTVAAQNPALNAVNHGLTYLSSVMDSCHQRFWIYEDVSSPCNHFHAYG